MDKIKLNVGGGGIFSKTMIAIQNTELFGYGLENCHFDTTDQRALGYDGSNPFNFILDQSYEDSYKRIQHNGHKIYDKQDKIEESPEFENLKTIASKLNYKQELRDTMWIEGKYVENTDVTAPVKSYWKNNYGIYNMGGNVAEMIAEKGITKGGSWREDAEFMKIKNKNFNGGKAESNIGFRYFMEIVEK